MIDAIGRYTLTPVSRRHAMAEALEVIDEYEVPGDVVECGVWRGGNIILARLMSPKRKCWLYDTFAGMTKPTDHDKRRGGASALEEWEARAENNRPWALATLQEVRENFTATDTLDEKLCRFVVGDIVQTLKHPLNRPDQIALLRLDTDWYESTRAELETLYPLLSPGGILIVDDYGHWQGARKAVDEYFDKRMPEITWIDYSAIVLVKP